MNDLKKYIDIAAQVEPLKLQIIALEKIKLERDQLQIEIEQITNEMHTLSTAFELRGMIIYYGDCHFLLLLLLLLLYLLTVLLLISHIYK